MSDRKIEYTKEQKGCFKKVKNFFDEMMKEYQPEIVKWAFNRKLNWEREKAKLAKEKSKLESRLKEISEELN